MQCAEVELDPQEAAIAEAGSLMYMDQAIEMKTIFGDGGSAGQSISDKFLSAGKRVLTGESLFLTQFTNLGYGKRHVTFAAPFPGKLLPQTSTCSTEKSFAGKMPFSALQKGSLSVSNFNADSAQGSSAVRALSCKNLKETAWPSFTRAEQ